MIVTTASQGSMSRCALTTVTLLESFDQENSTQSLADISRRHAIPKATALRILRALECRGYVVHDKRNRVYSLAPMVLALAESYLQSRETLALNRQALSLIAKESGETSHVSVLSGTDIVYIDIVGGEQPVRAFIKRYERIPAYCAASGKAILAYSDPSVVETVMEAGFARRTSTTITSRKAFLADLRLTKERGYAISNGEWMNDVMAVSAPLLSHQDRAVGAIGVAWPKSRSSAAKVNALAKIVCRNSQVLVSTAPTRGNHP